MALSRAIVAIGDFSRGTSYVDVPVDWHVAAAQHRPVP